MKIISGLIGVVIGVLLIKYAMPITDIFGRIAWAEEHMRGGLAGTYSLYKVAGVVVIILSLLYMFGGINILLGPIANLFSAGQ